MQSIEILRRVLPSHTSQRRHSSLFTLLLFVWRAVNVSVERRDVRDEILRTWSHHTPYHQSQYNYHCPCYVLQFQQV